MRWFALPVVFLVSTAPVLAQLPAPNAAGVSSGHMHVMVREPQAFKKIWAFCVREVSPQHLAGACLINVRLDVRA